MTDKKKAAPWKENGNKKVSDIVVGVKPLDTIFSKAGFSFEQLRRDGYIALFRKRQDHWPEDEWTFEVVRLCVYPEQEINNRWYPQREAFPSSESWGTDGFSYNDQEAAMIRFRQMVEEANPSSESVALDTHDDSTPAQVIKTPQRAEGVA